MVLPLSQVTLMKTVRRGNSPLDAESSRSVRDRAGNSLEDEAARSKNRDERLEQHDELLGR